MKIKNIKILYSAAIIFSAAIFIAGAYYFFPGFGRAADDGGTVSFNKTEIIYDYLNCADGTCRVDSDGVGRDTEELFKFYGRDAECLDLEVECKELKPLECKEALKNKYESCRKNFNHGQAGSFEMAGDLIIDGIRTYISGFNNLGRHWYKSGREEEDTGQMALLDNGRGVFFGGDLYLNGNEAIFEYGPNIIGWNMAEGEKISLSGDAINFYSRNRKVMEILWFSAGFKSGLEAKDVKASEEIYWQGNKIIWSPVIGNTTNAAFKGSGENKQVLMFCDSDKPNCAN